MCGRTVSPIFNLWCLLADGPVCSVLDVGRGGKQLLVLERVVRGRHGGLDGARVSGKVAADGLGVAVHAADLVVARVRRLRRAHSAAESPVVWGRGKVGVDMGRVGGMVRVGMLF